MTLSLMTPPPGATVPHPSVETVPVGASLWRVIRPGGAMLGYIDRIPGPGGDQFRVRRMLTTQRRFIPIGDFSRFEDALVCFHF